MKRIVPFVLLSLALSAPAAAQQTVPIDIVALLGQIPEPPSTLIHAHGRATCAPPRACDASPLYAPLEARLTDVARQLELAIAAGGRPAGDPMMGMTPEEMRSKLEAMTREEQVAFAVEMSRQQNAPPRQESAPVVAALAEAARLTQEASTDVLGETPSVRAGFTHRREELRATLERELAEINTWFHNGGFYDSQGLPNERWEAGTAQAMERRIAAHESYLQGLAEAFSKEVTFQQARFSPFQQKLVAIAYGQHAVNAMSRTQLLAIQQMMVRAGAMLAEASRTATEDGAALWVKKLEADAAGGASR